MPKPGGSDGLQADGGAEEEDGDFEHRLGAEGYAGRNSGRGGPGRAEGGAEEDGEDEGLEPGTAEDALLDAYCSEDGAERSRRRREGAPGR